jgi:hypothetical protein
MKAGDSSVGDKAIPAGERVRDRPRFCSLSDGTAPLS